MSSGKKSKVTSATNEEAIKFYRANERPYGIFSNLFRCEIEFEGKTYPTAEHAYQAGKALKPAVRDWILAAPTPSLAAMAAHGLYVWDVVPNWQSIKFDRMRAVLRAKFLQHPDIASVLLSTGSARLVEAGRVNNAVNRLWGEVNGQGQNMLGLMLMELRAELSARGTPSKVRSKETKAADNKRKNKRGSGQQRKTK
nr:NADAR family protein [Bradyrhizobium sp. Bra64]